MTSKVQVTHRLPWQWRCRQVDTVWHNYVDDTGWARTHAEAVQLADEHARRWHNPDHPVRVCGIRVPEPGPADDGSCALPEGHLGSHRSHEVWDDLLQAIVPGILTRHFDIYGYSFPGGTDA